MMHIIRDVLTEKWATRNWAGRYIYIFAKNKMRMVMQMGSELCCCTDVLLEEITRPENTRDDVAATYTLAIQSSEPTNWGKVNMAIIERWSLNALKYIKEKTLPICCKH